MWSFCRRWAAETNSRVEDAIPALATAYYLEEILPESGEAPVAEEIIPDPDNPVITDDDWLAERERKLHERLNRDK